ncbi:hypothetical protein IAT38_004336 [Cryptococcus sp. DSM 104549]
MSLSDSSRSTGPTTPNTPPRSNINATSASHLASLFTLPNLPTFPTLPNFALPNFALPSSITTQPQSQPQPSPAQPAVLVGYPLDRHSPLSDNSSANGWDGDSVWSFSLYSSPSVGTGEGGWDALSDLDGLSELDGMGGLDRSDELSGVEGSDTVDELQWFKLPGEDGALGESSRQAESESVGELRDQRKS